MTWLLVLVAWTVCAGIAAPVVGRALVHGELVAHPARPAVRRRSPSIARKPLVRR
jgi:hypothetical protein